MDIPVNLCNRLKAARHVVAFTGAGMSAESGVPTFRDSQTGLWSNFRAEDLATPHAFLKNPVIVWQWYASRREAISKVQPNRGHLALVQLQTMIEKVTVVTQNIDNLHKRAGQEIVVELHGNIERVKCFEENRVVDRFSPDEVPPTCPFCGGLLRPDVVWFGELLPAEEFKRAEEACGQCDVLLVIGTSGVVYPAAALPQLAVQSGAYVVEVNPERTPFSRHADVSLQGPSGKLLPEILECLT